MKKLRIIALMHETLVPPEDVSGFDLAEVDWKMEYDVSANLRDLGHEVLNVGVGEDLRVIRQSLDDWKPDIVFNMLEDFHDFGVFDQNIVSYLELLRVPYTGCNPRGLMLARDKGLSKMLLAAHRIPVPESAVMQIGRKTRRPKRMEFPLIVKSLTKEASQGISQASVVDSDERLRERVQFIHQTVGTDAIVERYIEGREFYIGVLGNQRLDVFPVWELNLSKMEATYRIATDRVKWNRAYQKKHGIKTHEVRNLPDGVEDRIRHVAKRAFRSLCLSGYGRVDVRVDTDGKVYVLEANPNPQLAYGEDFSESAEHSGIQYPDLLQKIVTLGLSWRPERLG
jgi:D-alanine-D-alanine ligase